uniref:Uncharacterized protein n=1 Tax=Arundo donax TaxID=35708 RepID=A0A0A9AXI4_ARUDO
MAVESRNNNHRGAEAEQRLACSTHLPPMSRRSRT